MKERHDEEMVRECYLWVMDDTKNFYRLAVEVAKAYTEDQLKHTGLSYQYFFGPLELAELAAELAEDLLAGYNV